jgi:hypothetical protein
MRTLKNYLIPLLMVAVFTIVTACTPQVSNPLVGTWKLVGASPDDIKVVFTADGNMHFVVPTQGQIIQGKYVFSDKEIKLNIDGAGELVMTKTADIPETPDPSKIVSLNDRRLRALESEAKIYVGSMNKAQQAHYLEKQRFGKNSDELEVGIPTDTENYTYAVQVKQEGGKPVAIATATPKNPQLKAYSGLVSLYEVGQGQVTTLSMACVNVQAGTPPVIPLIGTDKPVCGAGSEPVK